MSEPAMVPPGVDAEALAPPVRALIGDPAAVLEGGWTCRPLQGGAGEGLGVYRLAGRARSGRASVPWALILKLRGGGGGGPGTWDHPAREALAYHSGLLARLPAEISAPRCLGAEVGPDGSTRLWLEPVADAHPGPWSLARYAWAARRLGRFNGAYLAGAPLPDDPCFSRGWLRGWVEASGPTVPDLARLAGPGGPPLARRLYPPPVAGELERLWAERGRFLAALDRLPRTLCHQDAFRRNLLGRRGPTGEELVAVDWAYAGHAAVGEELVPLVVASLLFFEAEGIAPRDLDAACFAGYAAGLREAGWAGDERLVRLGFAGAAALRYTVGTLRLALPDLVDPALQRDSEELFGRPYPRLLDAWAGLWPFQLGLAEEARALLRTVG